MSKLEKENEKLKDALQVLVNMYVNNRGTDSEFITCITPRGAYSMTKKERKKNTVWKAWDKARKLLGEEF